MKMVKYDSQERSIEDRSPRRLNCAESPHSTCGFDREEAVMVRFIVMTSKIRTVDSEY